jgi:hypothetical protein
MCVPPELVEISSIDEGFPASFRWRTVKRRVDTIIVAIYSELFKLSVQVTGIPKEYVV